MQVQVKERAAYARGARFVMVYCDGRWNETFHRDAFIKIFSLPALKRRLFYAPLIIMGDSFTQPTSLEEDYQ